MPHLKKSIFQTESNSLWDEKKGIVSQILLSKLLYIGQIYSISKLIKEEIEKTKAQLSIWTRYFRHSTKLSRTSMDLCHGLCLFGQKQILRSYRNKNLQNQNNEVLHHHHQALLYK